MVSQKLQMQGAQKLRSESHLQARRNDEVAAQRRRWTFYETIKINKLQSRPLGGDQQIGAKIADGEIDFLIFFWDPLEPVPHDPDVKALLRMAVVWNVPIACNRSSADFMISSHLMDEAYDRLVSHYDDYRARKITRGE
jgi:methylglyoxal synthase